MRQIIESLAEKIRKLETEVESISQLDEKIAKRLKQNQRLSTLNETEFALEVIEMNAKKRITHELFIEAEPIKAKILLNAIQIYNFNLITSREIHLRIEFARWPVSPFNGINGLNGNNDKETIGRLEDEFNHHWSGS